MGDCTKNLIPILTVANVDFLSTTKEFLDESETNPLPFGWGVDVEESEFFSATDAIASVGDFESVTSEFGFAFPQNLCTDAIQNSTNLTSGQVVGLPSLEVTQVFEITSVVCQIGQTSLM